MSKTKTMQESINPWEELKEALRHQALASGFDVAGFAPPHPPPYSDHLPEWLKQGCHGGMAWIARQPERRMNPQQLLPGTGVVLVVGINYRPPPTKTHSPFAAYACHDDYHTLLKKRVQELGRWLEEKVGSPIAHRAFVDSAPVLEKPLAVAAGLGWQGKNALLVSRHFGCWLLLAELFLALPLPPDSPETNHCATCDRCLRACPTDALKTPYQLDASRCLAYFTVESHDPIPLEYRKAMGLRIFGCDACITACPWNRFAPVTQERNFLPRGELLFSSMVDWARLDADEFARLFDQTPIQRLGVIRFLRNVAIALGNWHHPQALSALEGLLHHESPLVREHAAWGIGNLGGFPPKNY
ncbi:MAG: tRNA epoxyqueuosine(34) reductase QueG [Magnetococcales bacterium]|nr:tRNA epoxyqueuosine(34) reductase QueG [Magnetococcales bacterium]